MEGESKRTDSSREYKEKGITSREYKEKGRTSREYKEKRGTRGHSSSRVSKKEGWNSIREYREH